MQPTIKVNIEHKKQDVKTEDFSYDIKNKEGKVFHVKIHREIQKKKIPVLEH